MIVSRLVARAFTLIEVLVALAILAFLVIVLSSLLGAVNRAWVSSEQHVETFQDGRAIVNLIGRELSQAVISPTLQFVTNPPIMDSSGTQLTRLNSDSIFWQAPLAYSVAGSSSPTVELCEVGYYLDSNLNLKRFFVPPSDNTNYQIYASSPSDTTATWISSFVGNADTSTTIASNILALWVRCFDGNNELIPWLSSIPSSGSQLHYNSAAHFQPAIVGQPGSFKYTAAATASAHALPASVEITLVTVDERARKRDPIIPGMPHDAGDTNSPFVTAPSDVPVAVDYFARKLVTNKINSARTFSVRVVLANALR